LPGSLIPTIENGIVTLVYRGRFGTTSYFHKRDGVVTRDGGSGTGVTETYYRLDRTVDRNGNTLKYEYNYENPTLVTKIYDPVVTNRAITFGYILTTNGYRLQTVTDPLARSFEYQYDTNGMLAWVLKPHPDNLGVSQSARPKIGFKYIIDQEQRIMAKNQVAEPWDGVSWITWYMPTEITDANWNASNGAEGNKTTFTYFVAQNIDRKSVV